jgi:hypothetical protein
MSDAGHRPDATPDQSPRNQTGADKGPIKGPQRAGRNTQVTDTARGSEVESRNASNNRG